MAVLRAFCLLVLTGPFFIGLEDGLVGAATNPPRQVFNQKNRVPRLLDGLKRNVPMLHGRQGRALSKGYMEQLYHSLTHEDNSGHINDPIQPSVLSVKCIQDAGHENYWDISFNLSNIPDFSSMTTHSKAELVLSRKPESEQVLKPRFPWMGVSISALAENDTDTKAHENRVTAGIITGVEKRYDIFGVTSLVKGWLQTPSKVTGVLRLEFLRPSGLFLPAQYSRSMYTLCNAAPQDEPPMIVLFFGLKGPKAHKRGHLAKSRLKRDEQTRGYNHINDTSDCAVKELTVNFDDLGYNWIFLPKEYTANYCSGQCSSPLKGNVNPSNHAIIMTQLQLSHGDIVPTVSCVPSAMEPIRVMYENEKGSVVIKVFKDMIVKKCHCNG